MFGIATWRVVTCPEDSRVAQWSCVISAAAFGLVVENWAIHGVDLWNRHHWCLPSLPFLACSSFAFERLDDVVDGAGGGGKQNAREILVRLFARVPESTSVR